MPKWRRVLSLPRRWQRNHLIAKYGSLCHLCTEPFKSAKDITFDHWKPLSKGGSDSLENYRLAHESCNHLKGALSPEEFAEFQKGAIKWED
jgi:5-methylcytosine-specific restriction endonuclease McrA